MDVELCACRQGGGDQGASVEVSLRPMRDEDCWRPLLQLPCSARPWRSGGGGARRVIEGEQVRFKGAGADGQGWKLMRKLRQGE